MESMKPKAFDIQETVGNLREMVVRVDGMVELLLQLQSGAMKTLDATITLGDQPYRLELPLSDDWRNKISNDLGEQIIQLLGLCQDATGRTLAQFEAAKQPKSSANPIRTGTPVPAKVQPGRPAYFVPEETEDE